MFYHLGEHREGGSLMFNGIHQQMLDNKIDAFSKAFLATTVACARCHDHKLEAVSQRDYYSLAAVFMTPRWISRVIDWIASLEALTLWALATASASASEIDSAPRESASILVASMSTAQTSFPDSARQVATTRPT
jgi:hypothetical protein